MKIDEINRLVRCEAEEDPDEDVNVSFDKAKHATTKAVLLRIEGEDVWVPYSQLVEWLPEDDEAVVTEWIAQQNGLT